MGKKKNGFDQKLGQCGAWVGQIVGERFGGMVGPGEVLRRMARGEKPSKALRSTMDDLEALREGAGKGGRRVGLFVGENGRTIAKVVHVGVDVMEE